MTNGLDGMVAAETILSDVDGTAGRLVIRGHDVSELARDFPFESVLELLFEGFFVDLPRGTTLKACLGRARREVFVSLGSRIPAGLDNPLDALRAVIARIPDGDDLETAFKLVAAPAVFVPAIVRVARGEAPIAPDPDAGHAADMLSMLGMSPDPKRTAALDSYLAVVSDHGLNASTFAARIVASTRAGLVSSVLAGLSALKGPLHGGAPGPVIDMLDEIGTPERAAEWLADALARGDRLMGFGHRVYRVRDPRADALKRAVAQLAGAADQGRLAFAESVESAALDLLRTRKPDRPLDTNVEFYTALLLESIGFSPASFTSVFGASRVAGWIAHAREQVATGRLIRPQSRYTGPLPEVAA